MSWYRRTLYEYKGNKEWTKQGYESAKANFNPDDLDVDCSEKHFMITGSNSGIGLATAIEIARKGGILHLVCRNSEKAKEARSHIITTTGNDRITLYSLDLSKPREVCRWAEDWYELHDSLNVLIHNAGSITPERIVDEDGIEMNFAVNVLSVHIITRTLAPLLQRNADARVIMVSSGAMLKYKLDTEDFTFTKLEPFNGIEAQEQNKRQQVVMSLSYAQRYDRIHCSSMNPGWVDTELLKISNPAFYEEKRDVLRTTFQGADTVVWLAVSKTALKHPSGFFYQDRAPHPTHFPMSWTRSSIQEEQLFISKLDDLHTKVAGHRLQPQAEMSGTYIFENGVKKPKYSPEAVEKLPTGSEHSYSANSQFYKTNLENSDDNVSQDNVTGDNVCDNVVKRNESPKEVGFGDEDLSLIGNEGEALAENGDDNPTDGNSDIKKNNEDVYCAEGNKIEDTNYDIKNNEDIYCIEKNNDDENCFERIDDNRSCDVKNIESEIIDEMQNNEDEKCDKEINEDINEEVKNITPTNNRQNNEDGKCDKEINEDKNVEVKDINPTNIQQNIEDGKCDKEINEDKNIEVKDITPTNVQQNNEDGKYDKEINKDKNIEVKDITTTNVQQNNEDGICDKDINEDKNVEVKDITPTNSQHVDVNKNDNTSQNDNKVETTGNSQYSNVIRNDNGSKNSDMNINSNSQINESSGLCIDGLDGEISRKDLVDQDSINSQYGDILISYSTQKDNINENCAKVENAIDKDNVETESNIKEKDETEIKSNIEQIEDVEQIKNELRTENTNNDIKHQHNNENDNIDVDSGFDNNENNDIDEKLNSIENEDEEPTKNIDKSKTNDKEITNDLLNKEDFKEFDEIEQDEINVENGINQNSDHINNSDKNNINTNAETKPNKQENYVLEQISDNVNFSENKAHEKKESEIDDSGVKASICDKENSIENAENLNEIAESSAKENICNNETNYENSKMENENRNNSNETNESKSNYVNEINENNNDTHSKENETSINDNNDATLNENNAIRTR